jgi:KaiC/GvpD/RAD55 family RecA-like ATPase
MKTRKYEAAIPNRILSYMVLDDVVSCRIASQWRPEGLFDSPWSNLVGTWCVSYAKRFNKAPKKEMTSIFERWIERGIGDEKMVASVENFLYHLSDTYGDPEDLEHSDHILDLAGEYFNKVAMRRHVESIQADLERGDMKTIEESWHKFRSVNLGKGSYIDLTSDVMIHIHAMDRNRHTPLVTYEGRLGEFIGDALRRSTLYSIMAPDKAGKSCWLIDLAWRAVRNRKKVLFFDTGDSPKEEVISRFNSRILRSPIRSGRYLIPTGWKDDKVVREERNLEETDPIVAFRKLKKISRVPGSLRISCHDSSSINAEEIHSILQEIDRNEDWRPDVVVIDYADILAPPKGFRDTIDQIDETWKQLRRMSQERHCLVVTATQVAATAYGKESGLLGRKHFSGRKTKLAHVNGMLGINVSPEEKEEGRARVNWIVRRDAYYNESSYVRVAGNMAIGCPAIISC